MEFVPEINKPIFILQREFYFRFDFPDTRRLLTDGICPVIASKGDSLHVLHEYSLLIGGYFKSYLSFFL